MNSKHSHLSPKIQLLLKQPAKQVSPFHSHKAQSECRRHWDIFYKNNTTNFFKDRHWCTEEFPELSPVDVDGNLIGYTLLEVGCGVGNAFWPLLDMNKDLYVHCCDLSARAIEFVKQHELYTKDSVNAFACDITSDNSVDGQCLLDQVNVNSVDIISAIFVLSAIPTEKLKCALRNLFQVLKPGGMLLFRDYAVGDMAQLRFHSATEKKQIDENIYLRQDGTLSRFMEREECRQVFQECGFESVDDDYVHKQVENRKLNSTMDRIFLQARFRKPLI